MRSCCAARQPSGTSRYAASLHYASHLPRPSLTLSNVMRVRHLLRCKGTTSSTPTNQYPVHRLDLILEQGIETANVLQHVRRAARFWEVVARGVLLTLGTGPSLTSSAFTTPFSA